MLAGFKIKVSDLNLKIFARELKVAKLAKFGTVFFNTRTDQLIFKKYLSVLENNRFSYGQTRARMMKLYFP